MKEPLPAFEAMDYRGRVVNKETLKAMAPVIVVLLRGFL
jgi:hypothetical protein